MGGGLKIEAVEWGQHGEFELDSVGRRYGQWDKVVIRILGEFDVERNIVLDPIDLRIQIPCLVVYSIIPQSLLTN